MDEIVSSRNLLIILDDLHVHIEIHLDKLDSPGGSELSLFELLYGHCPSNIDMSILMASGRINIKFIENGLVVANNFIILHNTLIESKSGPSISFFVNDSISILNEDGSETLLLIPVCSISIHIIDNFLRFVSKESLFIKLDSFIPIFKAIKKKQDQAPADMQLERKETLSVGSEMTDENEDSELFYSFLDENSFLWKPLTDSPSRINYEFPPVAKSKKFEASFSNISFLLGNLDLTFLGGNFSIEFFCSKDEVEFRFSCSEMNLVGSSWKAAVECLSIGKSSHSLHVDTRISKCSLCVRSGLVGDKFTDSFEMAFKILEMSPFPISQVLADKMHFGLDDTVSVELNSFDAKLHIAPGLVSISARVISANFAFKDFSSATCDNFSIVATARKNASGPSEGIDKTLFFKNGPHKRINVFPSVSPDYVQLPEVKLCSSHLDLIFSKDYQLQLSLKFKKCDLTLHASEFASQLASPPTLLNYLFHFNFNFNFNFKFELLDFNFRNAIKGQITHLSVKMTAGIFYFATGSIKLNENLVSISNPTLLYLHSTNPLLYLEIRSILVDLCTTSMKTHSYRPSWPSYLLKLVDMSWVPSLHAYFNLMVIQISFKDRYLITCTGEDLSLLIGTCEEPLPFFPEPIMHNPMRLHIGSLSFNIRRQKSLRDPVPLSPDKNFLCINHFSIEIVFKKNSSSTDPLYWSRFYIKSDCHTISSSLSKEGCRTLASFLSNMIINREREYLQKKLDEITKKIESPSSSFHISFNEEDPLHLCRKDSSNVFGGDEEATFPNISDGVIIIDTHVGLLRLLLTTDSDILVGEKAKRIDEYDHLVCNFVGLSVPLSVSIQTLSLETLLFLVSSVEIEDHIKRSSWRSFMKRGVSGGMQNHRNQKIVDFQTELSLIIDRYQAFLGTSKNTLELLVFRLNSLWEETTELCVYIDILHQLRFFIDQDSLIFIESFFSNTEDSTLTRDEVTTLRNILLAHQYTDNLSVSTDLFFKHFLISEIELVVDYKPKRSIIAFNSISSFIFSIFKLEDARIVLQAVQLFGIEGISLLIKSTLDAWVPFVTNTQAQRIVMEGWTPIRTVVKLGNEVGELILLPMGRNGITGVDSDALSMVKRTMLHGFNLTSQLAATTKNCLRRADLFFSKLSGVTPMQRKANENPKNVNIGLKSGISELGLCLQDASLQSDADDSVNIFKAIPLAFIRPMVGVSEVVDYTAAGLANSLDPNRWSLREDKYKK